MTEKRFMLDDAGEVIDLQTAKFIEYGEEIVECLNNLHEEKEELKDALNQRTDQCDKYYDENEQLKKEVEDLKQALIRCAFDDK